MLSLSHEATNSPAMFPKAHTACSLTFACGELKRLINFLMPRPVKENKSGLQVLTYIILPNNILATMQCSYLIKIL